MKAAAVAAVNRDPNDAAAWERAAARAAPGDTLDRDRPRGNAATGDTDACNAGVRDIDVSDSDAGATGAGDSDADETDAGDSDAGDIDVREILARVQSRSRRPPARPATGSHVVTEPPKIWEMNAAQPRQDAIPGLPDRADPADLSQGGTFPSWPDSAAPRTRLLGFSPPDGFIHDPLAGSPGAACPAGRASFPVGWLVVLDGPGLGEAFTLSAGVNRIGRGLDQAISLDFGDLTISRSNHAALAFDDETGRFYLGHGGKLNLVRLNGRPVLSTEELADRDLIRIGATTLRFVALCGEDFNWSGRSGADDHARAD